MLTRRKLVSVVFYLLIVYFLATCFVFVGVIKHNPIPCSLTQRLALAKMGPSCLHMEPAMKNDEFMAAGYTQVVTRVCPGTYWVNRDYSIWDVNFNVVRTFRFHPVERKEWRRDQVGENRNMADGVATGNTKTETKTEDTKQDTNVGSSQNDQVVENIKTMAALIEPLNPFVLNTGLSKSGTPKIFHFIWTDEIIPSIFVENLKLFRKLHPSWSIHFWTLKAGEQFIQKKEPQISKVYAKLSDVFKADVLRYVLLYHIGGAYFDLDSKVIKPLDDLAEKYDCLLGPEPIENAVTILKRRSLLANSGLLCQPEHPFFRHVLDQIYIQNTKDPGPRFLTLCFNTFLSKILEIKNGEWEELIFKISIAPHDFFEFYVNNGNDVDKNMGAVCKRYSKSNKQFFYKCANDPARPGCGAMFKKVTKLNRMELEACMKWEPLGGRKREPSKDMYVHHEHYGTHQKNRMKALEFSEDNNISLVLPGITIHVFKNTTS